MLFLHVLYILVRYIDSHCVYTCLLLLLIYTHSLYTLTLPLIILLYYIYYIYLYYVTCRLLEVTMLKKFGPAELGQHLPLYLPLFPR